MEYFFMTVIALAAFVPWFAGGYATASGILFFVIGAFLLPLPALAVSLLLAWILGVLLSRFRYKNIVTLVVSIGFLLAYFYFYINMQSYLNELLMRGEEIAEAFRTAMPPFYAFGRSVADGNASDGLKFMLWAILPFAAAVALLAVNYGKVLTVNRGGVKIEYKERAAKLQSALSALTRKELARYRSKPLIILNVSMGSLLMLIGGIALLVKGEAVLSSAAAVMPALSGVSLSALCAALLVFLCSVNDLSASLISLEGRNLWIVKSSPVSPKTALLAKAGAHWLISAIPCFAASVCAGIVVGGSVWDWLVILLLPQTFIVLTAVGGLAINLNFPKLEWTNEIYVVKQSASVMITLFGGMGVIALLGLLYALLFAGIMSLTVYLLFCAAIFIIAAAAICMWLMNVGARKFMGL
jgi:ABC-2 type transport system permease protein